MMIESRDQHHTIIADLLPGRRFPSHPTPEPAILNTNCKSEFTVTKVNGDTDYIDTVAYDQAETSKLYGYFNFGLDLTWMDTYDLGDTLWGRACLSAVGDILLAENQLHPTIFMINCVLAQR